MYNLEYLPLARQDIVEIARYISHDLANPTAAENLVEKIVTAINGLIKFPYRNRVYQPIRPLGREYRKLIVENYIVFYSVDEEYKLITIARVIYARRDYGQLL